ncbi:mannose-ethanolamine phosphotransferase gpi13, partial [Linderina pennispora]
MLEHSDLGGPSLGPHNTMANGRVGFSELHEDWDTIIAHCLGVDHCGHRFGPDHPAMALKLQQMNQAIKMIVDAVDKSDKSTVLYVFGDHGMDPKGDHGGDSPREVDAALWVYSNTEWNSKRGAERSGRVLERAQTLIDEHKIGRSLDEDLRRGWWKNTHLSDEYRNQEGKALFEAPLIRSTPQIDIVSTMALVLGLPVPFNNLGAVIPEMFASDDSVDGEWGLLHALRLNSAQV